MKFTNDTFIEYANAQLRALKSDAPIQKEARRESLEKAVSVAKAAAGSDEFEAEEFKGVASDPPVAASEAPPAAVAKSEEEVDALFPEDFNDPDYLRGVPKKPKW